MDNKQKHDADPGSMSEAEIKKLLARVRAKGKKSRPVNKSEGESTSKPWQLHEMAKEERARVKGYRHGRDSENNMYDK